ncbi:hypothetical protein RDWZM_004636 [Blomia tropicalis]|uniref:Uncharacterized protein n=1 Tax=Blomia tropicalis TaxID=40697 RepID=A0A9Q0M4M3_BLOTA|nr:hypothetical protein RDWZM_004636 [Blomia tropicalis]
MGRRGLITRKPVHRDYLPVRNLIPESTINWNVGNEKQQSCTTNDDPTNTQDHDNESKKGSKEGIEKNVDDNSNEIISLPENVNVEKDLEIKKENVEQEEANVESTNKNSEVAESKDDESNVDKDDDSKKDKNDLKQKKGGKIKPKDEPDNDDRTGSKTDASKPAVQRRRGRRGGRAKKATKVEEGPKYKDPVYYNEHNKPLDRLQNYYMAIIVKERREKRKNQIRADRRAMKAQAKAALKLARAERRASRKARHDAETTGSIDSVPVAKDIAMEVEVETSHDDQCTKDTKPKSHVLEEFEFGFMEEPKEVAKELVQGPDAWSKHLTQSVANGAKHGAKRWAKRIFIMVIQEFGRMRAREGDRPMIKQTVKQLFAQVLEGAKQWAEQEISKSTTNDIDKKWVKRVAKHVAAGARIGVLKNGKSVERSKSKMKDEARKKLIKSKDGKTNKIGGKKVGKTNKDEQQTSPSNGRSLKRSEENIDEGSTCPATITDEQKVTMRHHLRRYTTKD